MRAYVLGDVLGISPVDLKDRTGDLYRSGPAGMRQVKMKGLSNLKMKEMFNLTN